MKNIYLAVIALLVITPLCAQTKKIKRPSGSIGVSSVDQFVSDSFRLYDKVYRYDGYAQAGTPLSDEDIDVLEAALDDVTGLSEAAPHMLTDLDGIGALKQAKAVLRINRAKKALKYSMETTKRLLADQITGGTNPQEDDPSNDEASTSESPIETSDPEAVSASSVPSSGTTFKINSKFDFVPGDELLFYDDFSQDFIGDFPSKWNTNGSGEIVTVDDNDQRWLQLIPGTNTYFIPLMSELPEEYTIELDLLALGIDGNTSSTARLRIALDGSDEFRLKNHVYVALPLVQFIASGIQVYGKNTGINNTVKVDVRDAVLNQPHLAIAVNKERLRFWVNDEKYIDIPKFLPPQGLKTLKISVLGTKTGKEQVLISNLKIAQGGQDLRRTLLNTGKVSTNGILFASGSAVIQPQSYGILRQISQVLKQDESMHLTIIGHTDSDGEDAANLTLSRKRAQAVKQALIDTYQVEGDRLETDGKGESDPVTANSTADGKAQNRRVEFIKTK
ncbi:OmpA family protein [Croceiramulus getboli]|nr:OmpA family protein [Flavobacteriaceae bacterium YJPT1-3]